MSIDAMLIRTADGALRPATQVDIDVVAKLPIGKPLGCTIKTLRNGKFHRKLFALLGYLFDVMPRVTAMHKGQEIAQSFTKFREDMVILSGHRTLDVTRGGDLRYRAQSLSYAECSQELAHAIYSDLIDKALELLGGDQTRKDLDKIVEQILGFDA